MYHNGSEMVQSLLEACLSVKAKCLFLCLAELHNLNFFNELNLKNINLGAGKRVIEQGGTYYSNWQLSLLGGLQDDLIMGGRGCLEKIISRKLNCYLIAYPC